MKNAKKSSASRLNWWGIGLFSLFGLALLVWLGVYPWKAWTDRHLLYLMPGDPLTVYHAFVIPDLFANLSGYPFLLQTLLTLPYTFLWLTLMALILGWIARITAPGFLKISLLQLMGILLLGLGGVFLILTAMTQKFITAPFLAFIAGGIYLYFRPSLKVLSTGLLFCAWLSYFLIYSAFYVNFRMDASKPCVVKGRVTDMLASPGYFIVQPDRGGSKLTVKVKFPRLRKVGDTNNDYYKVFSRFNLPDRHPIWIDGIRAYEFLPESKGGRGQPGIEVYQVHRGLLGIQWQEYEGGYRLFFDQFQAR